MGNTLFISITRFLLSLYGLREISRLGILSLSHFYQLSLSNVSFPK